MYIGVRYEVYFFDNLLFRFLSSDKIERSDLEGNYREVIVQSVVHPFGLALYGHHIYWTDWRMRGVFRAEKHTGANQRVMVQGLPKRPMDIHVYSEERQGQCKSTEL